MVDSSIPRFEYPRPQFVREDWWVNLNGKWTYTFDFGKSGMDRGFAKSQGFDAEITVPFCPESKLSGVQYTDFIDAMWYHREIEVPDKWKGRIIMLHFGAVDYMSEVYIDGKFVGRHWGGSSSFSYDITRFVSPGSTHDLVVHVQDDVRSRLQPVGKQSQRYGSYGCHYTRTTGIWQTVWMEAAPPAGLKSVHIIPDLEGQRFAVIPTFYSIDRTTTWNIRLRESAVTVAEAKAPPADGVVRVLPVRDPRPWKIDEPFLYDLWFTITDRDGEVIDRVNSYAGLRKLHIEGNKLFLNNQPIYLRLVLDQGFFPDGIWTAPNDDALQEEVQLGKVAGFNGARLHQKAFEERFHYWADKYGYFTWAESPSWGLDMSDPVAGRNFLNEWRELVIRDRNHPSIIAWTPFNETRDVGDGVEHHRLQEEAYDLTKALDITRPVNDASGYVHVKTDLWTVHTYEQDPAKLKEKLSLEKDGRPMRCYPDLEPEYQGQPYLVDEFGGIKWVPTPKESHGEDSWGYGEAPKTQDEYVARLEAQVDAILSLDHVAGFCYTQLTDVEQEQNGIYLYDHQPKFSVRRIGAIFSKPKPGSGK